MQTARMGRRKRPHLPGMVFHLVSRTHGREPWFDERLRTTIVEIIRQAAARTDARLLAYAVMPNHLHIVIRQGRMTLAEFMQPLMRRVALRVQRRHGIDGSVVGRRFRDWPCASADYVRSAVVYTHLNPWRAGFCDATLEYEWTSHGAYLPGANPADYGIDPVAQEQVLRLFADRPFLARDALAQRYLAYVEWRMRADRYREDLETGRPVGPMPIRPSTAVGDWSWNQLFGADGDREAQVAPAPDLRDFIACLLRERSPDTSVSELRGRWGPRGKTRLRESLVRAAAERGYRTGEIARFFGISPSLVSALKGRRA